MLIQKPIELEVDADATLNELRYLLTEAMKEAPVCCSDCELYKDKPCEKNCTDAAEMLTSEKGYPLESKITPLVFELKRLGVYEPCWSCEGHLGLDGELWKLPMVWFYANSMIYVRVLSQAIKELFYQKEIANEWVVIVTHANSDSPAICFSLQPDKGYEKPDLDSLQNDISTIAERLVDVVKIETRRLISTINK